MRGSPIAIFLVFLRLGCTSFGGPIAHLGYFRAELVAKRQWLSEATFADIVALCQFMPGPASSQTGMAIGLLRGGPLGMIAAWLGFTLPSGLLMTGFAYALGTIGDLSDAGWLHGLKLVAVAVVAQAVWGMGSSLAADRARASLAVAACLVCLAAPSTLGQIGAILLGAAVGMAVLPRVANPCVETAALHIRVPRWVAVTLLATFLILLFGLPWLAEASVVPPGWVDPDTFLAGYGATQAMPGPLFSFAAFLGAIEAPGPNGWIGALLATLAIFASSFLLVGGLLPFWDTLRYRPNVRAAMRGVNAAVVGVLLAALFTPIWTGTVHTPADFGLALVAFLLLTLWKLPPWCVVAIGAFAGWDMASMGVFG
jgi:chromate transporter